MIDCTLGIRTPGILGIMMNWPANTDELRLTDARCARSWACGDSEANMETGRRRLLDSGSGKSVARLLAPNSCASNASQSFSVSVAVGDALKMLASSEA